VPEMPHARNRTRGDPLQLREHAEGGGLEHRDAALRADLRRDQQEVSQQHGQKEETGTLSDVDQGHAAQSIEIFRSRLKSDSIFPAPSTTEDSGSSAIASGRPVSSRSRLSRFFSSEPPPVRTMPRSTMSADSSGGVRSSATRTAST